MLGGSVVADDNWHSVLDADGDWCIGVQRAPNHQAPEWPHGTPLQMHVDLWVDDLTSAHDEVLALGARLLQPAEDPDAPELFNVYADPAAHPFCLCWRAP